MKVAVIGSRTIKIINMEKYLPEDVTEILPDYDKYGKVAPLKRNDIIVDISDLVIAFWDGKSRGTKYVIDYCNKNHKELRVYICNK